MSISKQVKFLINTHKEVILHSQKVYGGVYIAKVFTLDFLSLEVETDSGTISGIVQCNSFDEFSEALDLVNQELRKLNVKVFKDHSEWVEALESAD